MATNTETTTDAQPGDKYILFETSIKYDGSDYKYASYLPHHVPGKQPPLQEFEHPDPGARADPDKKALLSDTLGAVLEEITPAVGTEVRGGVVVFRDQDLADAGPEAQRALGRHFDPLHVHQHGGQEIKKNVSSIKWHSDMSYEINGMGTPIFFCLDTPKSGGDTLYLSTTAAYDNFSEDFRKRLYGLYATHSGFDQARAVDHQERYTLEFPIQPYRAWSGLAYSGPLDPRDRGGSALRDFKVKEGETKRHMLRITPQAERPFFAPSV